MIQESESITENWIGIELWTIYSCIRIIRKSNFEIVEDKSTGSKIIPSIIYYKEKECYMTLEQILESTILEIKRL